jgi:hypothetical protein
MVQYLQLFDAAGIGLVILGLCSCRKGLDFITYFPFADRLYYLSRQQRTSIEFLLPSSSSLFFLYRFDQWRILHKISINSTLFSAVL